MADKLADTKRAYGQRGRIAHAAISAPRDTVLLSAHREVQKSEEDNVGVESAHKIEAVAEGGVRAHQLRSHQTKKANAHAQPQFSSNPYSRWQQKRAIRKAYAEAKRGRSNSELGENAAKAVTATKEHAARFVTKNKKGFLVAGVLALMLVFLLNVAASCSLLVQSTVSAIGATTYPVADSDMLAAEAQYCALEQDLQQKLDTFEQTHDFDEYHYDLDTIEHDPYVLISAITALHGGEWTIDEVGDIIQTLFDRQYILTETVTSEIRYRTETETDYYVYHDPETGRVEFIPYEYEVQVPYNYFICTVKLENFNLSHVPVYIMSEEQLAMYATYMGTLGNRPDLFPDSSYVGAYYNTDYEDYEIPPSALEDERFAAMMKEAEKYLGCPYVWGGSTPSTSFDCSGFVSWVLNNCGVGWNVGRLGANGLRSICTSVSSANAKPGDLIFFQGTYDAPGASHVGIYVGNGMMIHCGDPIQYTNINTNYWQSHFLSFGRLPNP